MHPLNNGSQATTKPTPKARVGTQGYFTESGENNTPSYPGADWFNAVIDEFLAMLTEMSIDFNPDKFDHWQRAMAALKNDATTKANQALADAQTYADKQDSSTLASAKSYSEDAGHLKSGQVDRERLPAATTTSAGVVELATDGEAESGSGGGVLSAAQLQTSMDQWGLFGNARANLDDFHDDNYNGIFNYPGAALNSPELQNIGWLCLGMATASRTYASKLALPLDKSGFIGLITRRSSLWDSNIRKILDSEYLNSNATISASGVLKIPVGQQWLVIQWGSSLSSATTTVSATFTETFTTLYQITLSENGSANAGNSDKVITSKSTTGFSVANILVGNTVSYIAMGII